MHESIDFAAYQSAARETATYSPIDGCFLTYPVLGLCAGVGKVVKMIKRVYRDDGGTIDPSGRYGVLIELGDVLWFLCALCDELEVRLEDVARFDETMRISWAHHSLARIGIEMHSLSGAIAGYSTLGRLNTDLLRSTVSHLLAIVQVIADRIGVSIEDVMAANIRKVRYHAKNDQMKEQGIQ